MHLLAVKAERRQYMGELGVDEIIILKWVFKRQDAGAKAGFCEINNALQEFQTRRGIS
jgi:hypothetical protein